MSSAEDVTLHHILIDVGYPMSLDILSNVIEAVRNVSSLLCHASGPTCLSLLSLSTINSEFQMTMNCVKCKTGIGRIAAALKDIKLLGGTCQRPSELEYFDALHVAYSSVIEDLRAQSKSENFWSENPDVHMNVITSKNGRGIQLHLDKYLKSGQLPMLKRNSVVEITSSSCETLNHDKCLVELHKVLNSKGSLENCFKKLLICVDNRDIVHIDLPGLTVKCNIVPIMISPTHLPFAHRYTLKDTPNCDWQSSPSGSDSSQAKEKRLVVVNRLSSSGLGETQIFGEPTMIVPASRDRFMDEESYSANFQTLRTLGKSLNDKDEWLIAKLNFEPSGFFVMMPGENLFLVKPLLSAELRLPAFFESEAQFESPDHYVQLKVDRSLAGLHLKDELREEEYESGLYDALIKIKMKKSSKERKEPFSCWAPSVSSPSGVKRRKLKVESPVKYFKMFKQSK